VGGRNPAYSRIFLILLDIFSTKPNKFASAIFTSPFPIYKGVEEMSTIILWVIIAILFCANPALFFLGIIAFLVYKGFSYQQPSKFAANQADSSGSDQNNKNQNKAHTCEDFGRFKFKDNEDDPEVVKMRKELQKQVQKNRDQADEDLLSEAEREYAARKRAEELGQAT
jgi:hypothetical protein